MSVCVGGCCCDQSMSIVRRQLVPKSYLEKWREYQKNSFLSFSGRPRWLSWMRRPTGDQEVAGSTPTEVGNILSWRLIMKYFLRSFSPFR